MKIKHSLHYIAQQIRKDMISVLEPKESHHIGCSLSIVDILSYLYFRQLHVYPKEPKNPNRDIFILSKGHGALGLYATLFRKHFFSLDLLMTYDKNGGQLPEHASTMVPGVELSTGSLGHGLSVGLGFATALKNDNKKNKIYVLMSDGEFDEGSNWEAIMYAGYHKLNNLIVIVDVNGFQGYASTKEVLNLDPLDQKVIAFNWETYKIDGHEFKDMKRIFHKINHTKSNKPIMIFAKTIKGKGVAFFEGKFESHYISVDKETKQKILCEME